MSARPPYAIRIAIFVCTLTIPSLNYGQSVQPSCSDSGESRSALTAAVYALSDYRFRGVSFSGGTPVTQGEFTINHCSGFYGNAFVSTLGRAQGVGSVEVDLEAGWTRSLGKWGASAGVESYLYPGSFGASSYGIRLTAKRPAGITHLLANFEYSPRQSGTRTLERGEIPDTYFSLTDTLMPWGKRTTVMGTVGYGRGSLDFNSGRGKFDDTVGISYSVGRIAVGLSYVGTNVRAPGRSGENVAGSAAILSVRFGLR